MAGGGPVSFGGGLTSLQRIGTGFLRIEESTVETLDGLEALSDLGDGMSIRLQGNPYLIDITGLSGLTGAAVQEAGVWENEMLPDCAAKAFIESLNVLGSSTWEGNMPDECTGGNG